MLPSKRIVNAKRINPTTVELLLANNQRLTIDFYGENILRNPEAIEGTANLLVIKFKAKQKQTFGLKPQAGSW